MSISKLYENIDELINRRNQLVIERTETLAQSLEAKAQEVRTSTPSIANNLEWAAQAFRNSAQTGDMPPCDSPRLKELKSLPGIDLTTTLFGEEDRKALTESWIQEHYPQASKTGEVRSVHIDEKGQLGFTLDPAIEHKTGEVARNIGERMHKLGSVCCLYLCYSYPF